MAFDTRLIAVGADPERDPVIDEAAALLRRGELVAFPTETVYGLGGNAADPEAVAKIFIAKQRPADNPLIVHVGGADHARVFCADWNARAERLAAAFWPGPLTLVLPATALARETVTRGMPTVALRAPAHPVARALIGRSGLGLAAPSANRSGRPSPTRARHVFDDLAGRIPLILDGGPCAVGIESTVVDLSEPATVVLRPGAITPEQIEAVIGAPAGLGGQDETKRSPGLRYRHYSPAAPVLLIEPAVSDAAVARLLARLAADGAPVGYLGARTLALDDAVQSRLIRFPDRRGVQPEWLYHDLREMDRRGAAAIVVDAPTEDGVGLSLLDRLNRAASVRLATDAAVQKHLQGL